MRSVTTKRDRMMINDCGRYHDALHTHAGIAVVPILFGAFSSKLAIDRVLQGSIWPFVKKTWVGFMCHPP